MSRRSPDILSPRQEANAKKNGLRWTLEGFLDEVCVCVLVFRCFVFGFALLVFGGFTGHAVQLAGSQFLNQGPNFRPLPWTHAVLTTRPPGRPQCIYFPEQQLPLASLQHTQLPWCVCPSSAARRPTEPVWAAAH